MQQESRTADDFLEVLSWASTAEDKSLEELITIADAKGFHFELIDLYTALRNREKLNMALPDWLKARLEDRALHADWPD